MAQPGATDSSDPGAYDYTYAPPAVGACCHAAMVARPAAASGGRTRTVAVGVAHPELEGVVAEALHERAALHEVEVADHHLRHAELEHHLLQAPSGPASGFAIYLPITSSYIITAVLNLVY